MDYDNKKNELEREFLEMAKGKQSETDKMKYDDLEAHKRIGLERELWDGEKADL